MLFRFARWITGADADAEELLARGVQQACDPDGGRPWNPERGSFGAHMRIVLRDLAHDERRMARSRRELIDGRIALDEERPCTDPLPDEALSDARDLARLRALGARLRERIAHNARALAVFDHACQGVEDAAQVAARVGCTVADVYACNRQLARAARQILDEDARSSANDLARSGRRAIPKAGRPR